MQEIQRTTTAAEAVKSALTAMKERQTTSSAAQERMTSKAITDWAAWFKFQTLGDKQLEGMVEKAANFVLAVRDRQEPYWLTFLGLSGTGKTYLAKAIYRWAKNTRQFQTQVDGDLTTGAQDWYYWPEEAATLQRRDPTTVVYEGPTTQFVVLDEIGGVKDSTGYVTSQLSVILGARDRKWTVLTSNLTLQQINDRLDTRIASRIIRGKNAFIEVDTIDFARRLRNGNGPH